ncbi:hypothetical protein DFQ28_004572 [Apophysomyces sp. BC1034]|nr:hypothetical protein DFQ28_004572 [Apophysomyces sp. BC1034]
MNGDSKSNDRDAFASDDGMDGDTPNVSILGKRRRYNMPVEEKTAVAKNQKEDDAEHQSEIDDRGEKKVDRDGHLLGGREYKVNTFTLPKRGNRLLMFAMDPAKMLGYRDSYLFFQRNPQLVRVRIEEDEKQWLVQQGLLVTWFRNRDVAIVTARSVFKCFGARIIKKGRKGRDDYFENEIDYDELHEYDADLSDADALTFESKTSPFEGASDMTWMHRAALAVRGFNVKLRERRTEKSSFYDIHTNVKQLPTATQPTVCTFEPAKEDATTVTFEIPAPCLRGVGRELLDGTYDTTTALDALPTEIRQMALPVVESEAAPFWDPGDNDQYPISLLDGQYQGAFPM